MSYCSLYTNPRGSQILPGGHMTAHRNSDRINETVAVGQVERISRRGSAVRRLDRYPARIEYDRGALFDCGLFARRRRNASKTERHTLRKSPRSPIELMRAGGFVSHYFDLVGPIDCVGIQAH